MVDSMRNVVNLSKNDQILKTIRNITIGDIISYDLINDKIPFITKWDIGKKDIRFSCPIINDKKNFNKFF